MSRIISEVLFTPTVIASTVAAIILVWTSNRQRKQSMNEINQTKGRKRASVFFFIVSIISAVFLLINGINDQIGKNRNENDQNTIRVKSEASLANTELIKKQDSIISSQSDSIRLQQDSINKNTKELSELYKKLNYKNEAIIKKQYETIEALNKASSLQQELFNQTTGGKSIPELIVDTDYLQLHLKGRSSAIDSGERMVIYLENSGKYPITNVQITKNIYYRYWEGSSNFPDYYLSGFKKMEVEHFFLKNVEFNAMYFWRFLYSISWKNLEYSCQITFGEKLERPEQRNPLYKTYVEYFFNSHKYNSFEELKVEILKVLNN